MLAAMASRPGSPRKCGSWTSVVIFVSLYVLLLESVIEWALVLYLYGNRHVDKKMTPSLLLALIASFFTVPLVVLHSILAWQYNKVSGFDNQKEVLSKICTYLLRLTIIVWLAGSVAGLVVVSQQASCLPDNGHDNSFWKVGVSCALHRAAVIVAIIAFITVCLYFCSRELCDHPYDVSLLGVYKKPPPTRDNSVFSGSSVDTNDSLKNDILYLCRSPDVTYGRGMYLSSSDNTIERSVAVAGLQQPTPIHPRPQLRLSADPEFDNMDMLSGSTISPNGTLTKVSPCGRASLDLLSISRTPTTGTSSTDTKPLLQTAPFAELPSGCELPTKPVHKRQKSSISSLRKLLPKVFPFSLPLSADPQIRALSESPPPDLEKQAESTVGKRQAHTGISRQQTLSTLTEKSEQAPAIVVQPDGQPNAPEKQRTPERQGCLPRSITMSSDDAPEVVTPTPPSNVVRRSNTSQTAPMPRTFDYYHHGSHNSSPNYSRIPPPNPMMQHPVNHSPPYRGPPMDPSIMKRQTTLHHSTSNPKSRRHTSHGHLYHFENNYIPRHTQSQYNPHHPRYSLYGPGRGNSPGPFDAPSRRSSVSRRNDVEIIYPSTRRPRSTTYGGLSSSFGHLDSIRETGASVDETNRDDVFSDDNTYRGANRTSMPGY